MEKRSFQSGSFSFHLFPSTSFFLSPFLLALLQIIPLHEFRESCYFFLFVLLLFLLFFLVKPRALDSVNLFRQPKKRRHIPFSFLLALLMVVTR